MTKYFTTTIGLLRLYGFLEGISLLVLVFVAVPYKYILQNPVLVKAIGPIHGALFLLFVFNALRVGIETKVEVQRNNLESFIGLFHPIWNFLH